MFAIDLGGPFGTIAAASVCEWHICIKIDGLRSAGSVEVTETTRALVLTLL